MTNNNNNNLKNTNKEGKNLPSSIIRKCVACGNLFDRQCFIRIMKDYKTGKIIINPDNNQFGKSMYLCKSAECLKLAIKKKRLKNLNDAELDLLKSLCN